MIAPVALGMALQVNYGQYHPLAIARLSVALAACAVACFWPARERAAGSGAAGRALYLALAVGLAVQFWTLLTTSPMATLVVKSAADLLPFRGGVIAAAACAALALMPSAANSIRRQRVALFGILLAYAGVGLWVLQVAPPPPVDVCVFQREACRALLSGHNPYAITFAVPYDDPGRIYAPGSFANGRLLFGYPYPPISLLWVLPGYLLGDFRLSHLLAMTLAGGLIGLARPRRAATAAAALLLFTPRAFFVLEAGWTEPLAIFLLAGTVFLACRAREWSPIGMAVLVAAKQYLVLAAPLLGALREPCTAREGNGDRAAPCGRGTVRAGALGLGLAAVLSLGLILWDVPAFVHSVVALQFRQPMRMDALSYGPWCVLNLGRRLPVWVAFGAVGMVWALAIGRRRRGVEAFCWGVGLVFGVFFALNKQAFCNYYLFVIGAMCCGVAVMGGGTVGARESANGKLGGGTS